MGLDMYAYKARADIVGDAQVDIDVEGKALVAAGFSKLDDQTFDKLEPIEKRAYYERRDQALEALKTKDILDTDFSYWRKFNNLHGWMERLYREKGGTQESFNCTTVRLDPADLDRLERDAKAGENLDPTGGFFFGSAEVLDEDDRNDILEFVQRSREAIGFGYVILYSCWW